MRRDLWESPLPTDKKRSVLNEREKDLVRTGTRTQNLLLRRQAPYPLGHTDNYEFCFDHSPSRTRHSSLGVEHSLSKRKVVGSNPACGLLLLFIWHVSWHLYFFGEKETICLVRYHEFECGPKLPKPGLVESLILGEYAVFGWCSWLSRQSNTLKVPSSILGSNTLFSLWSSSHS